MLENEEMVDLAFVAEKLRLSPRTVKRYTDLRGLPAYRPGRDLRFYWSEVQAWLEGRRVEGNNSDSG